jgi:hypothetical protein
MVAAGAPASAEPSRAAARALPVPPAPWTDSRPDVVADVRAARPLVVQVVVALCNNRILDCGSAIAGRPADPAHNIYWGAVFGARRFLERERSGWERVALDGSRGPVLERAVFRRRFAGAPWGVASPMEMIVVLEAIHGDEPDDAVARFFALAAGGGTVTFRDGATVRTERVHVVGYAGHNRLLDGVAGAEAAVARGAGGTSFVLACYSESSFRHRLERSGSRPVLLTRASMAPEGYLLDAVLQGLGGNESPRAVRARAVDSYVRWASLSPGEAGWIFP